jgi:hypothetical protein
LVINGVLGMNIRFKVLASYNILQYVFHLVLVHMYVECLKMPKKSQFNEYRVHTTPSLPDGCRPHLLSLRKLRYHEKGFMTKEKKSEPHFANATSVSMD